MSAPDIELLAEDTIFVDMAASFLDVFMMAGDDVAVVGVICLDIVVFSDVVVVVVVVVIVVVVVVVSIEQYWSLLITIPGRSLSMRATSAHVTDWHCLRDKV